ncbi:transcriptional regulator [Desulfofalx alkaliphila]|uniref:transcriptional regulator n=1 Tax=Desulfofalx alkaliphila TaxID=105483 RepID=UPI0004E17EF8|nr:transcriptional regulator [Desulfofalx alkaliphila]
MDLVRIGNKIVSKRKIHKVVDELLQLRASGIPQTEAASRLGIDRTFVSRLESLGEIRKGKSIAVIGFPIVNKQELRLALEGEGVDFIYLLTERERWDYVKNRSGLDLFNSIMEIIAKVHACDQVIVLGSNQRIKLVEAVLDKDVIGFTLGESPITEDCYVESDEVVAMVRAIKREINT